MHANRAGHADAIKALIDAGAKDTDAMKLYRRVLEAAKRGDIEALRRFSKDELNANDNNQVRTVAAACASQPSFRACTLTTTAAIALFCAVGRLYAPHGCKLV